MTTLDMTVPHAAPAVGELPPFASRLSLSREGRTVLSQLKTSFERWLSEDDGNPVRAGIRDVIAKYREHGDWPISVSYHGVAMGTADMGYQSYQDGVYFQPAYNPGSMDEVIIHVMTARDIDCETIRETVANKKPPYARDILTKQGYYVTPVSRHSVFSGPKQVPRGTDAEWKLDGDRLVHTGECGGQVSRMVVYLKVCDGYYRSQTGEVIQLVDELAPLV